MLDSIVRARPPHMPSGIEHPTRIVSLLAAGTEIVCALGFRHALVGRSHECDWPPGIEALPVLTEPRIAPHVPSREIDVRVRERVREALALYRVDPEGLRAARPDVVVTQTQCQVCAVTPADLGRALRDWVGTRPRIVSLEPSTLGDVREDIRRVATALGAPGRGEALVAEIDARLERVRACASGNSTRPRIACIEWIEPLMGAGNWMPELVALAGGEALFGETGSHTPAVPWEALAAADPDVVLVAPCGFDLARTRREIGALTSLPGWGDLRAVREGRVALADGVQWFNRSGPRLAESAEILAEVLHPGTVDFGWRSRAWAALVDSE